MKVIISKKMALLSIISLTVITGYIVFCFIISWTNPLSQNLNRKDTYTLNEANPEVSLMLKNNNSVKSQAVADRNSRSQKLIGTWVKHHLISVENYYPDNSNWHLCVTFNSDGSFIWYSKRYESGGKIIDESLTGKYSVERGFLISYRFDQPSPEAQEKLPNLFAFWPNKLFG